MPALQSAVACTCSGCSRSHAEVCKTVLSVCRGADGKPKTVVRHKVQEGKPDGMTIDSDGNVRLMLNAVAGLPAPADACWCMTI